MKIKYTKQFQKDFIKLFSNNWYYAIPRFFDNTYYRIKWAYQRVVRGFDDTMIWNYHSEMTDITIKILTRFKTNLHGYPTNLKNTEEWNQILIKIIKSFEARQHINNSDFMRSTKQIHTKGIFKGMTKSKLDKRMLKRWELQRDEGAKLFIKYFDTLWD